MSLQTILDIILVVLAIWMIVIVRGLGGIVGRAMTYLTSGALITGFAHTLATMKEEETVPRRSRNRDRMPN